jgi:4'-phosphopantetheinyl transferase
MGAPLLPLPDDEAHVFYVRLDRVQDASLQARYAALLTPEETERQRRFRFEKNQLEFLVTRALVRTTLSRYVAVPPTEWRFQPNAYGCPRISHPVLPRALRFNLSNTDGLVAIIVSAERDVGVDVERLDRRGQTVEIADRFFSPSEVRELRSLPGEEAQRRRFFDYWTLKEAYIKAREMGLQLPLDQFSFHLAEAPVRISFGPGIQDDPGSWQFALVQPTPEHRLAYALRRRGEDLRVQVRETLPLQD